MKLHMKRIKGETDETVKKSATGHRDCIIGSKHQVLIVIQLGLC